MHINLRYILAPQAHVFPTVKTIYRWIKTSILPVEFGKDITAVQKRRTSETGYLKTSFSNHSRFEGAGWGWGFKICSRARNIKIFKLEPYLTQPTRRIRFWMPTCNQILISSKHASQLIGEIFATFRLVSKIDKLDSHFQCKNLWETAMSYKNKTNRRCVKVRT